MVEIQLRQMSVSKLITRFRLQPYSGATNIDDGNQAYAKLSLLVWFLNYLQVATPVVLLM